MILPSIMDKIKDSALKVDDWKFILNKGIGLTGKRYSQGSQSGLYDTEKEANVYLKRNNAHFPKHVRDTELWYIEHRGERKQLKNGLYLIQALIYDTMRTKLFLMYKELREQGINVVSVKTDCIYTDKKPDTSRLSFRTGSKWGNKSSSTRIF